MTEDRLTNRRRSRGYPGHDLSKAVEFLRKIKEAIGLGQCKREDLAEALGHVKVTGHAKVSGPAGRKIGCLTHFGLMDVQAGGIYQASRLAQKILTPTDDAEGKAALVEAFKFPSLYKELYSRYADSKLPSLLPNILVREFGIVEKKADSVVRNFRASAKFIGFLEGDVLKAKDDESSATPANMAGINSSSVDTNQGTPSPSSPQTSAPGIGNAPGASNEPQYKIPLSGRRVGSLTLPLGVDKSDLERIKSWIDLMQDVLTESEDDWLDTGQ